MKVTEYRWIGMLVHNYEATCRFLEHDLGLELDWIDNDKEITMFRFPSGQSLEIYGPSNRIRNDKYRHFNGSVVGLEVDDIIAAHKELVAIGIEFASEIEQLEDGSIKWSYFWGPDGQFYCLHQHVNDPVANR